MITKGNLQSALKTGRTCVECVRSIREYFGYGRRFSRILNDPAGYFSAIPFVDLW